MNDDFIEKAIAFAFICMGVFILILSITLPLSLYLEFHKEKPVKNYRIDIPYTETLNETVL